MSYYDGKNRENIGLKRGKNGRKFIKLDLTTLFNNILDRDRYPVVFTLLCFRFVAMVPIRPGSDRLKALLTNKGIYIVRSGPPSIENIGFHVHYSSYVEAVPMLEGR